MRTLTLEFAPSGYACGALVVQGPSVSVRIQVTPKLWGYRKDYRLTISGREHTLEVAEMSRLTIEGPGEVIRGLRTALEEELRRWGDGEHPLFRFGAAAAGGCNPAAPGLRSTAMWGLVSEMPLARVIVDASRKILTKTDVASAIAEDTSIRLPELKRLHAALLLGEVAAAAARRLPLFRQTEAELQAVRGRIDSAGLLKWRANPGSGVLCEYDELDLDDPWSRVVRAALRRIARDQQLPAALRSHALALDSRWHGVSALPPPEALRGIPYGSLPRKLRVLHRAFPMARSLLRSHYGYGTEARGAAGPAVAASLVIDTSDVYEELLKMAFSAVDGHLAETGGAVKLLQGPGGWGYPDITIRRPDGERVLVDAKYKTLRSAYGMPKPDQYQRFAYAVAGRATALFSYADGDQPWAFDRTISEPARTVGQGVCPFPTAAAAASGDWLEQMAEHARTALQALDAHESSVGQTNARVNRTGDGA